jgi:hypothetical protein
MTPAQQEQQLRDLVEVLITGGVDAERILRRVAFFACALNCPSAKGIAQIAKDFQISRQAVHKQVDTCCEKLAVLKANYSDKVDITFPSKCSMIG